MQPRGSLDEQAALVKVGVENAVVERLAEETADHRIGERRTVEAFELERGRVGQRATTHPFERQHAPADAFPDDGGRAHVAVGRHHLAHFARRGGLEP